MALVPECFVYQMLVSYDPATKLYGNSPGVTVRPRNFGDIESISDLVIDASASFPYMKYLIAALQAKGYASGKDLFAAPYDWRMAQDGLEQVGAYSAIVGLIESVSASSGGAKVALVAHSMGNLVAMSLLKRQGKEWSKRYIHRYISLAGPFGGSLSGLGTSLAGLWGGGALLPRPLVWAINQGSPALAWLAPYPDAFGKQVIVTTPTTSYKAAKVCDVLKDSGNAAGAFCSSAHTFAPRFLAKKSPVPTACIYGTGIPTDATYVLGAELAPGRPANVSHVVAGDGDGLVNLESLRLCRKLTRDVTEIPGITHQTVLDSPDAHQVIFEKLGI